MKNGSKKVVFGKYSKETLINGKYENSKEKIIHLLWHDVTYLFTMIFWILRKLSVIWSCASVWLYTFAMIIGPFLELNQNWNGLLSDLNLFFCLLHTALFVAWLVMHVSMAPVYDSMFPCKEALRLAHIDYPLLIP